MCAVGAQTGANMSRKKVIAGNWKMNMTPSQAVELVNTLKPLVETKDADVVFCVPSIDIFSAMEAAKGSNIQIGAQNMYYEDKGAFTGEISADMLLDAGVNYVIIGHSERREYFAETDITVNKKVMKAFEKGLCPIICCGETLTQREQGVTIDFVRQQIKIAFLSVSPEDAQKAIVAYEPIWAIGTGKVATTEQAQEVCKAIRDCLTQLYGEQVAQTIRVLYGGSVSAGNAAELFAQADIDGGLVGGASLKADFGKIVNFNK
jgi:triosephosphate isomerase